MTIYSDGTTYLVVLDADRAFLHWRDTGETSEIDHPQTLANRCKGALWEPGWDMTLPASLIAAIHRMGGTLPGEDPARGSVGPAGHDPR